VIGGTFVVPGRRVQKSVVTPARRKAVLDKRRRQKMAESAHAYVRGNTARFYQWLAGKPVRASLPAGPDIWICGDCHTGNLGPVADVEGNIDIQIRDLDQTVIGNPAHDLLRLGLSLAMAARSADLPGVTTALMLEQLVVGYISGLSGRSSRLNSKNLDPINRVMRQASKRHWKHLAEERINDVRPEIPLGPKFWSLTNQERKQLEELVESDGLQPLVQRVCGDIPDNKVSLLDAAYWMKGCSSLGRLRYAALINVGNKKGSQYRLLDVKEATEAVGPRARKAAMPSNNAERVVAGANALSPYLGERMVAANIAGKQVVVRELRPQDMKFELQRLQQAEAIEIARLMAGVVGRAHGRQLENDTRRAWARELRERHSKGLDAPRWLWGGVLDLAALHEAAYLEHCRQYALGNVD
jgi:uncharacterized protein (DUF2252 family)